MHEEPGSSVKKTDRTIIRIIVIFILVAVLNASISVATALTIQANYNSTIAQQHQQSQVVFRNICNTLHSSSEKSLQQLAVDLKC